MARHVMKLSFEEIKDITEELVRAEKYIEENTEKVENQLLFLTEADRSDLEGIEQYFMIKLSVIPGLKSLLEEPVWVGYDSVSEIFDEKD